MIYFLFVCSGLSGLIYQVVWVRAFGNVFGNTIHSASLVVAVFMLGLGVGSYAGGAWADRRGAGHPGLRLRAFGSIELAIGLLALAVSLLLPHLSAVSASISSYVRGAEAWYELSAASHLARLALAILLLTPITALMGATLTLLIRHVVGGQLDTSGWRIALLYAANTAGAAIGCFLTDFALVPAYGLSGAQFVAFGFNVVAAAGALYLGGGRRVRLKPDTTKTPVARRLKPARDVHESAGNERAPVMATAVAIALSGFAAMGMEIVWFRHFSILLGEYRAVFSLLLAIVLCGIGAGALAGGWTVRRARQPARVWMLVQGGFVAATLLGLSLVDARAVSAAARGAGNLDGWARAFSEVWFNARPIVMVAGVPALLMGFAFPVANALVQRVESRVGRRAGLLYLANTAGAVCGSLAAGFVLLPGLGIQATTTVLVTTAAAAIVPLRLADRAARGWPLAASLVAAAAAIAIWIALPPDFLILRELLFARDRMYALSEGLTEVIAVTDGPNGGRVLVTNGHPMSSTELFSQRYMRGMAHIPLLSLEAPERVLVLCYGVGNTAHAATLHPSVQRVDIVDLSKHVLAHSSYFREFNHDVLNDPRVTVYINDGRHHLQMSASETYDLITLEPPPIVHAGVASLYSREFYASARARLTPRGYLTQWLPVFGVPQQVVLSMVRAFVDVFPTAVLLSGAHTNLLLVGTRDEQNVIDPQTIAAALAAAPAVRADLQRVELATLREIVGSFVASSDTLVAATREAAAVTDDRPIQEYGKRSLIDFGDGGIPPALVDVRRVASWCPGCFSAGTPVPLVEGLDTYLAVTELAYRSPHAAAAGAFTGRTVMGSGYLGSIVPESPELQRLLAGAASNARGGPDETTDTEVRERYARATVLLEQGQFSQAESELRAVLALAPESVEALNNMGVALASLGRLEEAVDMFQRALALQPDFADARRNLEMARKRGARMPGVP